MSDDEHLAEVETVLQDVLATARDADLDAGELIVVEQGAQRIHAAFGGEGPDAIYPDDTNNGEHQ